jgi:hypothetical protein
MTGLKNVKVAVTVKVKAIVVGTVDGGLPELMRKMEEGQRQRKAEMDIIGRVTHILKSLPTKAIVIESTKEVRM